MDIAAEMVMDETTWTKIDDFDLTLAVALDQNVLGLEIAVNQMEVVNIVKSIQDLLGYLLKSGNIKVVLLFDLSVVLAVFVQVVS